MGKNDLFKNFLRRFNLGLYRPFPRSAIEFIRDKNPDKELVGAEVGVFKGENALSIMKTLNMKKLYLVDPYLSYEGYEPGKLHENKEEMIAKNNLSKFKQVVFIKKMSLDALTDIPNNLDFAYLDANHEYEYVSPDMKGYYKKLRKGGVLAGHDIQNGFYKGHDGVTRAFVEFAKEKNLMPYIWAPDWWFIKE